MMHSVSELETILDLARWAPSGDNRQPWRFEVRGNSEVRIHINADSSDVYDLDGRPTLMAVGCLLENITLAARAFGKTASWTLQNRGTHSHVVTVRFSNQPQVVDPLVEVMAERSVDRRRYRTTPLTPHQREALSTSVGDEFEIVWFGSWMERLKMTRLTVLATALRMRIPEAFSVHQQVVDTTHRQSKTGIPVSALGLSWLFSKACAWTLKRWSNMRLSTLLGGLLGLHVEMDILPGLLCASHFALVRKSGEDNSAAGMLRAGAAMQRFWLTATHAGLVMQPNLAPVVFARYASQRRVFTAAQGLLDRAHTLHHMLARIVTPEALPKTVLLGRVGVAMGPASSRSMRMDLRELLVSGVAQSKENGSAASL